VVVVGCDVIGCAKSQLSDVMAGHE